MGEEEGETCSLWKQEQCAIGQMIVISNKGTSVLNFSSASQSTVVQFFSFKVGLDSIAVCDKKLQGHMIDKSVIFPCP